MTLLLEPLAFDFMQRALAVAIIVAVVCAVLSCFLVLKGWSLMGDAVSHAVLPGIVLAHLASLPIVVGAFVAGLSCALATRILKATTRIREDAIMGIVFSGMFAFGLVLFVAIPTDQHLNHILFGNVLGVTWRDLVTTAAVALPTVAFVVLKRRDLLLAAFDPGHARTLGLPVVALETALLVALALAIVASIQAVGVILVVAMLITPGAIGYLITQRFDAMLSVACAVAVLSSVVGVIASFHLDAATGPTIVLAQAFMFAGALAWSIRRNRVSTV
jgi:manganese/iron transport system permease protein